MTLIDDAWEPKPEACEPNVAGLRVVVVINESSGTLERGDFASLRTQLAAAFERHGIVASFEVLNGRNVHDVATEAVAHAEMRGIDAIVVGGGDGTIRTVASVLSGTAIPLGIIPLGTFNHFAKDAGIPIDIDGAVAVIAARCMHCVDVGEVNGRVFINNSSIGVYPFLVLRREQARRLGSRSKWVATIMAALTTLRRFPLHRLSIFANGAKEPVRTPCLFVGNNHYGLESVNLGQRDRLDGGELCLYVAKQQNRLALLWLALRASLGLIDQHRDLRITGAVEAEIRSRKSRLFVAMDGEVELMRPPLLYRSRPGALRVLGPPPAPS